MSATTSASLSTSMSITPITSQVPRHTLSFYSRSKKPRLGLNHSPIGHPRCALGVARAKNKWWCHRRWSHCGDDHGINYCFKAKVAQTLMMVEVQSLLLKIWNSLLQRHTDTDKDKYKYKVLPRPNVCYIYQKQGVQGYKILYWLSMFHIFHALRSVWSLWMSGLWLWSATARYGLPNLFVFRLSFMEAAGPGLWSAISPVPQEVPSYARDTPDIKVAQKCKIWMFSEVFLPLGFIVYPLSSEGWDEWNWSLWQSHRGMELCVALWNMKGGMYEEILKYFLKC